MPPTSVHRFVAWTRLGNKSKEHLHQPSPQDDTIPPLPEHGREKENNAVAADPLPSRDSLDRPSVNVGQSDNTPRPCDEGEDMDAPKDGAITGEYVTVPSSSNPRSRYCPYITNGQSTLLIPMHPNFFASDAHPSLCGFQANALQGIRALRRTGK